MKTLEEDIKSLERAILSEARAEAEQIRAESVQKADAIRLQAQAQAEVDRKKIMEQATREAERIRSQAMATSQLKARTSQLEHREKILEQIFESVRQQLADVQKRKDYEHIVLQMVREAVIQLNARKAVLRADKTTQKVLKDDSLEKLSKELNANISFGKALDEGTGVIVEASDGHLHYDNTLETRLNRMQSGLRSGVYQILTGESA